MTDTTQTSAGPIATARAWLSATLQELTTTTPPLNGWQVCTYAPQTINPPCLVITESDPMLTFEEGTIGTCLISFDVVAITRGQANPDSYPLLEEATDALLQGLARICIPQQVTYTIMTAADQLHYMAARFTLNIPVKL